MITVSYKDAIPEKGVKQEYPCIKKHFSGRIVLFTNKGFGCCLNFDDNHGYDFMGMGGDWCEKDYALYEGSIVLENKI